MLGPCWVLLGRLAPMFAHLGTMLGVPGFYVGTSWLCVGLSWGHVAPSWDYVERRKDIKVQRSQFFTVFAVFLHIARFRPTSLETTKTTKFGSRAGKTHFLQQLDSLQFSPTSKFYCNLQCFLHLLNTHLEPQNLQTSTANDGKHSNISKYPG